MQESADPQAGTEKAIDAAFRAKIVVRDKVYVAGRRKARNRLGAQATQSFKCLHGDGTEPVRNMQAPDAPLSEMHCTTNWEGKIVEIPFLEPDENETVRIRRPMPLLSLGDADGYFKAGRKTRLT